MNGRHRSRRGIRAQDNGSTTAKKSANCTVGKIKAPVPGGRCVGVCSRWVLPADQDQRSRTRTVTLFPAIRFAPSVSGMEPLREDDPRSLGGYRLLARLAVGGMGRVYLALDAERGAVALKVAR